MVILGIDTSDNLCTAAISNSKKIIGEISLKTEKSHLGSLIPIIDYLLKETKIKKNEIDLFVIVQGPGIWSGIRIGVTTMKCMALSLNKAIVSINALDAFAQNYRFTDFLVYPIICSSKMQVYYSNYDCNGGTPKKIANYKNIDIDELLIEVYNNQKPSIFVGTGLLKFSEKINSFQSSGSKNIIISPPLMNQLTGSIIIETGIKKYQSFGAENSLEIVPMYLQESDAERSYKQKITNQKE